MTSSTPRDDSRPGGGRSPGLDHTAHEKEAGALVYLQEELGDARMRCDQLLRYVDRAVTLVEKSSHKDHFFEVAGDLIRGIPETLFKMHKALEAVALAANRIDYEEIKQDLRPEKVEELERVLKDVRVRQVQRRSQPMVNPPDAVQQLQGLAKKAKKEGRLDTAALSALIASLEAGKPRKVASGDGVAAQLEAMVHALQNPPQGELPSRQRLAQVLRKVLAEHIDVNADRAAAAEEAKRSRFEEGKPADPTKQMDPEDAKAWKENTDEYGDKFKKEAGKPSEAAQMALNTAIVGIKQMIRGAGSPKRTLHGIVTSLAQAAESLGQDGRITTALQKAAMTINQAFSVADMRDYADGASVMAGEDEKRSRFEEGKPADPTKHMDPEDAKAWKANTDEYGDKFKKEAVDSKAVEAVSANLPLLNRLIDTCEDTAKQLKHSLALVKRDPGRNAPQVDNISQHVNSLSSVIRAVNRKVFDVRTAADTTAVDTTAAGKTAAGKTAAEVQVPPPEESVIEEIMSWHGGQGSKLYSVGSRWYGGHSVELDSAEEAYDELKRLRANRDVLNDLKGHLKPYQRKTKKAGEADFWKAE